jgi:Bifunctional DNA primase/polymerase, N-terminal
LALALGLPAFPCRPDKAPACPYGFRDATADPAALRELWRRHPGPRVGVPTGKASGIDALDLDKKHSEAHEWWSQNRHNLPQTRTHRTHSGGLHLLFQHAPGLRCWTSRPVIGINGRADGGYLIWWPAASMPVLCDAPLAPWPTWLIDELNPPQSSIPNVAWTRPTDPSRYRTGSSYAGAALRRAADRVASASIGSRNRALNAEAYGISRLVAEGLLDAQEVADTLAAAAFAIRLAPREIEATLRSALRARGLL